jgi:hypothetical protein
MATTEQLMAQYGVAWFGFDEASGSVTDKLGGSYVGTVTGATRVAGWNGEGNAISFNGTNQLVQFNNTIIPTGEKTIRFKFKHTTNPSNSSNAHTLFATTGGTSSHGYMAYFNGINGFSFMNSRAVSNQANIYQNGKFYNDGKWHDFFFSWNGTIDGMIYLQIDDEVIRLKPQYNETGLHNNNLRIGSTLSGSNSVYFFGGQIDDFQIYNKVLYPSDFTQKHIAIKTTDDKNLVLSSKSGRVKEIPSVDEDDLVNQGYTWREIDDAVDSQVIDLTQTTTEYEKVSKTNTPLGNGKMFTIPLDEFKTISIEDNY